jgi:hypothetical protein
MFLYQRAKKASLTLLYFLRVDNIEEAQKSSFALFGLPLRFNLHVSLAARLRNGENCCSSCPRDAG